MKPLTKSARIAEGLRQLNIKDNFDVLYHLPRRYDNFTPTRETELNHKERVVLIGKLAGPPLYKKHLRVNSVTFPFVTQKKNFFKVIAYNRPYLLQQLKMDVLYTLIGVYNDQKHEINFETIVVGEMEPDKYLKPIYSLPSSIANFEYLRLVQKAFAAVSQHLDNDIPLKYRKKYRLISEKDALSAIHFPKKYSDIYQGLRVLKYRECLLFSLKTQLIRAENQTLKKGSKSAIELLRINEFIKTLPFKLTQDQVKAVREIVLDMNKPHLMYRLLQGDVGTGKTLVAIIALFANYLRGDQGALMVPTDTLANQHFQTVRNLFKDTEIKVELLTGNIPLERRHEIKKGLLSGKIAIVVGTHALFSEDIEYKSLGLAVIDEQHRFGVNQRGLLAAKGERSDLLLMSATPIPRSLALTLYGDLEVTTLAQFPRQKRDVITKVLPSKDKEINREIQKALEKNTPVFIIAPLIEEGASQRFSVLKLADAYQKRYPDQVQVLHGKLSSEEKEQILQNFKNGLKPILISTTVIEVGIDVPEASLMIIYNASSFGLATLHQLRGRIGRQGQRALCLLLNDEEEAEEKLQTLVKSNDGFAIAEADLRFRGPGEISGYRQSGFPAFQFANIIDDLAMFKYARKDAEEIIRDSLEADYRPLLETAKKEIRAQAFTNV
ncbi:MAG: ATP-dependent DNA helicase RecG [Bacilli bacterium]